MIYWFLYLFCGIVIAACYIGFGKTLAKDPDSGFSAAIAYKSKLLDAHPELNSKAQKMYGSLLDKGGCGLMVVVVIGLLCVLNQPQDTIMIGGNIVLVIELLYLLGLYLWMNQYLQKLTGSKPAKASKLAPSPNQPEDKPAASLEAKPASPLQDSQTASEPAAPTPQEVNQPADFMAAVFEDETQASVGPIQDSAEENALASPEDLDEVADHTLQSLILDTPNPPVASSAHPETSADPSVETEENEEADHDLQSLIQADVRSSVFEQPAIPDPEPAPTEQTEEKSETELSHEKRDAQIADALELATKTLAAAQADSIVNVQKTEGPETDTVFEETVQAVIEQAKQEAAQAPEPPAGEEQRAEIHTPGVKMVAASSSDHPVAAKSGNKD